MIDHPIIRNMERTGNPDGREVTYPICPCCGAEAEEFYVNQFDIVGCDQCMERVDVWDWLERMEDQA